MALDQQKEQQPEVFRATFTLRDLPSIANIEEMLACDKTGSQMNYENSERAGKESFLLGTAAL